jgi:dTDP-4-dehydrorhamnose 3,5-epimerase
MVRLVLHDAREGSPGRGRTVVIETGERDYALVTIPPGVWTGWQAMDGTSALVANCTTDPHDPDEVERAAPDSPLIPYQWTK